MPQIQVWINKDDAQNVEQFVQTLNDAVIKNKAQQLKAFFIFVDGSDTRKLTSIAAKSGSNEVCLAYLPSQDSAVKAYKVNLAPEVKNTVMLYRNRKVETKYVNFVVNDKGLDTLKADIAKLVK